jgi:thioredoxin
MLVQTNLALFLCLMSEKCDIAQNLYFYIEMFTVPKKEIYVVSAREKAKLASNEPVDLTDATFAEAVQKCPLVVVDCWAPWCGPCRMVAPIIEEMARDYAGRIQFGKLNVDENRRIAMQYQIMSTPMLLVFKNGKLVDQTIGVMPREKLEPKVTHHL